MSTTTDRSDAQDRNGMAAPPRGMVPPPHEVLKHVAAERVRLQPHYTDDYAKRALDDLTLAYYYEGLPVAYRSVAEGIEVLAVGWEETARYWESPVEGVQVKQP